MTTIDSISPFYSALFLIFVLIFRKLGHSRVFLFGLEADLSNTVHAKVSLVEVHIHRIRITSFTYFFHSLPPQYCKLWINSITVTSIGTNPVSSGKPALRLNVKRPYSTTMTTLQRKSVYIDEIHILLSEYPTDIKRHRRLQPKSPYSSVIHTRNSLIVSIII